MNPIQESCLTTTQVVAWTKQRTRYYATIYTPLANEAGDMATVQCEVTFAQAVTVQAIGVVSWAERNASSAPSWWWREEAENRALKNALLKAFNHPCPQRILADLAAASPSNGLTLTERVNLLRGPIEEQYID